jgi:hypothetical protein
MPDKHSEKLHRIEAPVIALVGGGHYREIASQLRELARRCRFRTGRGELVQARGQIRVSRRPFRQSLALTAMHGKTPEWSFWAVLGFLALMLLSALKR